MWWLCRREEGGTKEGEDLRCRSGQRARSWHVVPRDGAEEEEECWQASVVPRNNKFPSTIGHWFLLPPTDTGMRAGPIVLPPTDTEDVRDTDMYGTQVYGTQILLYGH